MSAVGRDAAPPRRVLVRLPNWVGDVVMATPVLRAVHATWPEAELVLEGRAFLQGLLDGLPGGHRFVPGGARGAGASWRQARVLRALRCDLALLLPDSVRAAVAPALARIPRRIGYARDPLRRLLLTDALPPPRDARGRRLPIPMVERYLRVARAAGCADAGTDTELAVGPALADRVGQLLVRAGLAEGAPFLLGAPGAAFGSSKLYPPGQFAAACDGIAAAHGLAVVLAPAPGEVELARDVAARMASPALCLDDPPTTLEELKGLTARAALVLSNDTGPRHVAVALGRPVLAILGPTDPRHTASQLERQRVLREDVACSPCHEKTCPIDHRCMTRLAPERVVAAAGELLAAEGAATGGAC